jgi:hypothetical protein
MNIRKSKHTILFFLLLIAISISNCKKEKNKPEGFSADFNTSFTNGGMVPDSILLSATYPDADSYSWNIGGVIISGKNIGVKILAAGNYFAELTASSSSYSETEISFFTLKNYPPNGTTASYLNGSGEINTVVLNATHPTELPIDSVENLQLTGGMDYDDDSNKLYYTGSIIQANPNGTEKETILFTDPPEEFIKDIVVDSGNDIIYYSYSLIQEIADEVYKMAIEGGQPELLFELEPSVDHLALNESEDIVFAVSEGDFKIIIYTPNEGLDSYSSFEGDKHALVWNNTENMLYFVESIDDNQTYDIYKSDPTTVNPSSELVVENASTQPILGIDIDETNQILYWTDQDEGAIVQLELNNPQAEPKIVFLGITNPKTLAIGSFGE